MSDILTGTPPDLTYGHEMVRQAWTVVWAVTSGALVVILGLDGAEPDRAAAPRQGPGRMAGDGPASRARPRGRCIVPVVVRSRDRRGARRVRLRRFGR